MKGQINMALDNTLFDDILAAAYSNTTTRASVKTRLMEMMNKVDTLCLATDLKTPVREIVTTEATETEPISVTINYSPNLSSVQNKKEYAGWYPVMAVQVKPLTNDIQYICKAGLKLEDEENPGTYVITYCTNDLLDNKISWNQPECLYQQINASNGCKRHYLKLTPITADYETETA